MATASKSLGEAQVATPSEDKGTAAQMADTTAPLVLISGGTGFLGKALVYLLLEQSQLQLLLLVRRKRGRDVDSRVAYYKKSMCFQSLPRSAWERVTFVEGGFDETKGGTVRCDGIERQFTAGEVLMLAPGESVTLMPGDWHAFWGEGGDVLIGEVSTVNDDETDNIFREPIGRFAQVAEDTVPTHLLVSDYGTWLR